MRRGPAGAGGLAVEADFRGVGDLAEVEQGVGEILRVELQTVDRGAGEVAVGIAGLGGPGGEGGGYEVFREGGAAVEEADLPSAC